MERRINSTCEVSEVQLPQQFYTCAFDIHSEVAIPMYVQYLTIADQIYKALQTIFSGDQRTVVPNLDLITLDMLSFSVRHWIIHGVLDIYKGPAALHR